MPLISWHPSFSVGVEELDEHHQHLAHLINQLAECFPDGKHSEKLVDILSALVSYAKYHFDYEERFLEEHDYPQLVPHRAEHVQFCEVIAETCYGASLGVIGAHELYDYLARWWTNHILHEDMKYKSFFAAREVGQCD